MIKINTKMRGFFVWMLTRVGILYLASFFLLNSVVDLNAVWRSARLRSLNRIMPLFDNIASFARSQRRLSPQEWNDYASYYQKLSDLMPQDAAASFFLGFCQFQLGDSASALKNFKLAASKTPQFFWFDYNLGMAFYNKKDYPAAVYWLRTAVFFESKILVNYLSSSKIYTQLLANEALSNYDFQKSFLKSLSNAYLVTAKSYYLMGDYDQALNVVYHAFSKGLGLSGDFYRIAERCLKKQKRMREAIELLRLGMERYPNDFSTANDLRMLFQELGLHDESEKISAFINHLPASLRVERDLFIPEAYQLF